MDLGPRFPIRVYLHLVLYYQPIRKTHASQTLNVAQGPDPSELHTNLANLLCIVGHQKATAVKLTSHHLPVPERMQNGLLLLPLVYYILHYYTSKNAATNERNQRYSTT